MSKHYRGRDKIFYVYYKRDSKPTYSGTLEMCKKWIENRWDESNYSVDHRSFRPEFR
jgi:hypothetical protein